MVQTYFPLPRRLVLSFGTIVEQDVLRFSGPKKYPRGSGKWTCFLGILETFVSQMANQELPVAKGIIFRHRDAGTSWEMELYLASASVPRFVGELQKPEFFSLTCLGAGRQAANQQSDKQPDACRQL